jgi:hypothetical protein
MVLLLFSHTMVVDVLLFWTKRVRLLVLRL